MLERIDRTGGAAFAAVVLGCAGPQSSLEPAGRSAEGLSQLFWWMSAGAFVIWAVVTALAVYAAYLSRRPRGAKRVEALVIGGGAVFPTIVLAGLLVHSLSMLPEVLAHAPRGSQVIEVVGEQYWWRVRYLDGGRAIDTANEIHLPVGAPVELRLSSPDVIHSFWVPSLGGKVDMIPGRRTRLRLDPSRTGTFRGVCAEYCGASHAWMAFAVVVEERDAYERWLASQAGPAASPSGAREVRGAELFLANGCGACHTVRGTGADGTIGPDLTHVGSRGTIGAGRFANRASNMRRFIARPGELKPGVHMPAFAMLTDRDLDALAAYLGSLR